MYQASLNDQFNQWLAVDETDGTLGIIYYDTVADAGRKKTDVWYQSSFDDGVTWSRGDQGDLGADRRDGRRRRLRQPVRRLQRPVGHRRPVLPLLDRPPEQRPRGDLDGEGRRTPPARRPERRRSAPPPPPGANQIQVTWGERLARRRRPSTSTGRPAPAPRPAPSPRSRTAVAGSPLPGQRGLGQASPTPIRCTGLDATGVCESAPSGCVQATATGACTLPPTFAGLASVTNPATASCGLALSWAAATPACAGPITYNVYRSTTPGFTPGPGEPARHRRHRHGLQRHVGSLASGTTYYYVVRAVDGANGLEDGNTVEQSAAPTGPVDLGTLTETFEGAGGFDNPGWTHAALSGGNDWVLVHGPVADAHALLVLRQPGRPSPTGCWSPRRSRAQAGTTLSFWHTFAFEDTRRLLRRRHPGDLDRRRRAAGRWCRTRAFTAGGFNGTVNAGFSNPIAGKRAWCYGTIGPMTQVTRQPLLLRRHADPAALARGDDAASRPPAGTSTR